MRLAFVTDTHFGYRRFERDAYEQGREAILSAAREADLLILGGDNFDSPIPKMETIAEVTGILREAISIFNSRGIEGAPIFAIHGNHDRRAKGFVHPTELMAQCGFLHSIHNKTLLYERNGERLALSGMGNVPDDMAADALREISCKPVSGAFNILVLHQSFQEFERIPHENYISFEDLPDGYDLYLCGHVHKQILSGKVLNPGSTVVTQLREEEAGQRGWLLYDTSAKKGEFRPIRCRKFVYRPIDFSEATPEQISGAVAQEIKSALSESPGAIVKLVMRGTIAKGFHAADISLPAFGESVFIENMLNSESLKEKIAQIKAERERKLSAKDLGMRILREKLSGTSYSLGDPEKLFEELLAGTALASIKERIEKGKSS
ncbi:MAG: DNA repair exonuclease [Candidatus Micrarchaeota archaeon]|nr:DNA repair exonuclease [Candidatus Micrarchaeota archaeon]